MEAVIIDNSNAVNFVRTLEGQVFSVEAPPYARNKMDALYLLKVVTVVPNAKVFRLF